MSGEMKGCPFCGGIPEMWKIASNSFRIHCTDASCSVNQHGSTDKECIAAWNRRDRFLMSDRLDHGVLKEIDIERYRQIHEEGWSEKHDDERGEGALANAAACYAAGTMFEVIRPRRLGGTSRLWPWPIIWWKPKDRRRDLIRAAALIVAEVERLDRAALRKEIAND